jgi:hypothetical protein
MCSLGRVITETSELPVIRQRQYMNRGFAQLSPNLYSPIFYTLYGCHDLSSRSQADHRVQDFGAERKVYVWNARVGVERMTLGTSCAS